MDLAPTGNRTLETTWSVLWVYESPYRWLVPSAGATEVLVTYCTIKGYIFSKGHATWAFLNSTCDMPPIQTPSFVRWNTGEPLLGDTVTQEPTFSKSPTCGRVVIKARLTRRTLGRRRGSVNFMHLFTARPWHSFLVWGVTKAALKSDHSVVSGDSGPS